MRVVSEEYANSSKKYMDDTEFFSTETIDVPICFRLFVIAELRQLDIYSAKWDQGFKIVTFSFVSLK